MRKPSARVLANRVDLYRAVAGISGTGYKPTYSAYPDVVSIPCSVQPVALTAGEEGGPRRVNVISAYRLIFDRDWDMDVRDKLAWTDSLGVTRTLFVETTKDNAGRNAAFSIVAVEIQ